MSVFSRLSGDVGGSSSLVRVNLHSQWFSAGRGLGSTQRDIDYELDSVYAVNRPGR